MSDSPHDASLGSDLAEKLRKLEALFARPGTDGSPTGFARRAAQRMARWPRPEAALSSA